MQLNRLAPRLFLSHAREDKPLADALATQLRRRHGEVWTDDELRPGDRLATQIEEAIKRADVFLALVTSHSAASLWVRRELQVALDSRDRTKVVPVRFAGADLPVDLSDVLYIDAEANEAGIERTAERVLQAAVEATAPLGDVEDALEGVLDDLGVSYSREPTVAGVRPDFLVETGGNRLVIEVKGRRNPSLVEAVEARTQAARSREVTGADNAIVVFSQIDTAFPDVGIVGLSDASQYLRTRFFTGTRPAPESGFEPKPKVAAPATRKAVFAAMPFDEEFSDVYWVAMTAAAASRCCLHPRRPRGLRRGHRKQGPQTDRRQYRGDRGSLRRSRTSASPAAASR